MDMSITRDFTLKKVKTMYHNNKELGNDFENELENILGNYGYWVYHTPNKNSGQPCDFILAKDNYIVLLDSKHCDKDYFDFKDIRENQILCFELNKRKGNTNTGFAIYFKPINQRFVMSYDKYTYLAKMLKKRAYPSELEPISEYLKSVERRMNENKPSRSY